MNTHRGGTDARMVLGCSLLVVMAGCAQNRAKIAYSSPPISPATEHRGLMLSDRNAPRQDAPLDDAGMTNAVQDALMSDIRIRATNVRISASKQVVTLQGVLNSKAAKDAATEDCLKTHGVKRVVNQITVDPEG